MEQSPSWEADRFSASQKIPRILRNPKFHYLTHKRPPPVTILSQLDPVHAPSTRFYRLKRKLDGRHSMSNNVPTIISDGFGA